MSGHDCDRPVDPAADHCGIDTHVRLVPLGSPRGPSDYKPHGRRPQRRPTLIVDEDYEIIDDVRGEPVELDPETFDPTTVRVSRRVQEGFTAHHGVDADEAIHNIGLIIANALEKHRYRRSTSGYYTFIWDQFLVTVSPDLQVATWYSTKHFERTPRMVLDGTPSRTVHRPRRGKGKPAVPEHLNVGDVISGSVTNVVAFGVFVDIGDFDALVHRDDIGGVADVRTAGLFDIGQAVTVEIINIDRGLNRVGVRIAQ